MRVHAEASHSGLGRAARRSRSTARRSISPRIQAMATSRSAAHGRRATRSRSTCRCRSSASMPTRTSAADIGRVCLKRGPFVYCAEDADNPLAAPILVCGCRTTPPLRRPCATISSRASSPSPPTAERRSSRTGTMIFTGRPRHSTRRSRWTAIPYYLWNNRGPGKMLVWFPED